MKIVDSAGAAVVTAIEQTMSSEVQDVELSVKFAIVIDADMSPTVYFQLFGTKPAVKEIVSFEF